MWKTLLSAAFAFCSAHALALELICIPEGQVYIVPSTSGMEPISMKYKILHRFSGKNLYLTDADEKKGEYLYGEIAEAGHQRYISGFKTIVFGSDEATAIVSHVDKLVGQLYVLKCRPMAK